MVCYTLELDLDPGSSRYWLNIVSKHIYWCIAFFSLYGTQLILTYTEQNRLEYEHGFWIYWIVLVTRIFSSLTKCSHIPRLRNWQQFMTQTSLTTKMSLKWMGNQCSSRECHIFMWIHLNQTAALTWPWPREMADSFFENLASSANL